MAFQQVVRQWDLESDAEYGLFEIVRQQIRIPWDNEEEDRLRAFDRLPAFAFKISDVVKRKARGGIPNNQRRKWWLVASGGFKLLAQSGDLWKRAKKETPPFSGPRVFFGLPIEVLSYLPAPLAKKTKKLCLVLLRQNRDFDFAPLIPILAAMLLLFMEAPLAYVTLQAMMNKSKKDGCYFSVTHEHCTTWTQAFRELMAKQCDSVAKHAEAMKLDIGQLVLAMFPLFFFPFMPLPAALTFFDSFVMSGRKVLGRFCLCLFTIEKKNLLNATNPTEFVSVVLNAIERLQNVHSMKDFLKRTFGMHLSKVKKRQPLLKALTPSQPRERRITFDQTAKDIQNIVSNARRSMLRTRSIHVMKSVLQRDIHAATKEMQKHIFDRMLPMIHCPGLVDNSLYCMIRHQLPPVLMRCSLTRVFSSVENGCDYRVLYNACRDGTPYVLAVRTNDGVFGAVISDRLNVETAPGGFYGRSMMFVFDGRTQEPFKIARPPNALFMSVKEDELVIGGPEPALCITDGMRKLISRDCETFGSPAFVENPEGDEIVAVELYSLCTVRITAPPLRTEEPTGRGTV